MSHIKFHSRIAQSSAQVKATEAKIEKFSETVTAILRDEAAANRKKLMYVFVSIEQNEQGEFRCTIDDSRDKISLTARKRIEEMFAKVFWDSL
jgi:uncharacterized protein YmfQ (DUF2313 family)